MFIFEKLVDTITDRLALQSYEKERREKARRSNHVVSIQKYSGNIKCSIDTLTSATKRTGGYSSMRMEDFVVYLMEEEALHVQPQSKSALKKGKKRYRSNYVTLNEFTITSKCDFLFPLSVELMSSNMRKSFAVIEQRSPVPFSASNVVESFTSQATIDVKSAGLNLKYST